MGLMMDVLEMIKYYKYLIGKQELNPVVTR